MFVHDIVALLPVYEYEIHKPCSHVDTGDGIKLRGCICACMLAIVTTPRVLHVYA